VIRVVNLKLMKLWVLLDSINNVTFYLFIFDRFFYLESLTSVDVN
jgi:hypothetical protein